MHTKVIAFVPRITCTQGMYMCLQISYLKWKKSETGLVRDGQWGCGTTGHDYPSMHHQLLHPCANEGGNCCGNSAYAPFLLRYESFFHSGNALLVLAYEVCSTLGPSFGCARQAPTCNTCMWRCGGLPCRHMRSVSTACMNGTLGGLRVIAVGRLIHVQSISTELPACSAAADSGTEHIRTCP